MLAPCEPVLGSNPIAPHHYAFIYIDHGGNLRHEFSPSVYSNRQSIFTTNVTEAFMKAVAKWHDAGFLHSQFHACSPSIFPPRIDKSPHLENIDSNIPLREKTEASEIQNLQPTTSHPLTQLAIQVPAQIPKPTGVEHCPRFQNDGRRHKTESAKVYRKKMLISVKDRDLLYKYYEGSFHNLQQTNCRILAKAYIKLIDPRKQTNFPYNGRKMISGQTQQLDPEETKPPWWPMGVRHREPDHLPKAERIRLLVHILCKLGSEYGINARGLREADMPIRCQISPAERCEILDEIYMVREEEEKFLDGSNDNESMVLVSVPNLYVAPRPCIPKSQRSRGALAATGDFSTLEPTVDITSTELPTKQNDLQPPTPAAGITFSGSYISPSISEDMDSGHLTSNAISYTSSTFVSRKRKRQGDDPESLSSLPPPFQDYNTNIDNPRCFPWGLSSNHGAFDQGFFHCDICEMGHLREPIQDSNSLYYLQEWCNNRVY